MTGRPIVIHRDGKLYLDTAYGYEPAKRYEVAIMAQRQSTLRCPEAREATRQCQEALKQFAAMEEAK